ncbi:MAG: hypothetical protein MZV63_15240 [Marinilabiliales bacterium]|nr:hypothetical protein [Marinilabiliales bacterium]
MAKAGKFSDGEEMVLPILTNRMLVTETMPLPVRSLQTKDFTLTKLVENKSTTLRNHKLTVGIHIQSRMVCRAGITVFDRVSV